MYTTYISGYVLLHAVIILIRLHFCINFAFLHIFQAKKLQLIENQSVSQTSVYITTIIGLITSDELSTILACTHFHCTLNHSQTDFWHYIFLPQTMA
jgi:hypothetical protein